MVGDSGGRGVGVGGRGRCSPRSALRTASSCRLQQIKSEKYSLDSAVQASARHVLLQKYQKQTAGEFGRQ